MILTQFSIRINFQLNNTQQRNKNHEDKFHFQTFSGKPREHFEMNELKFLRFYTLESKFDNKKENKFGVDAARTFICFASRYLDDFQPTSLGKRSFIVLETKPQYL
jgi:hypothetical protein